LLMLPAVVMVLVAAGSQTTMSASLPAAIAP
jgi:hypothetical protein